MVSLSACRAVVRGSTCSRNSCFPSHPLQLREGSWLQRFMWLFEAGSQQEAVLWWGASGLGPPQSPVPCVAPVVLDACPSCGKCWSSGNLCGSALSPRQEPISVLESSFLPLGHRKTKLQGAG